VGCASHTAAVHEGKIYIGGGDAGDDSGDPSFRIDVYNPATNSWRTHPISTPYGYYSMTTLSNHLIIAGGRDKNCLQVTNEIFLLCNNQLNSYTRMITPRCYATAAGYQEKLIIAGGVGDHRYKPLAATELFDSTTGQWYNSGDLPLPQFKVQSVIVNNMLYVLGGINSGGHYTTGGNYSLSVFTASLDDLSNHQLKWNSHQDAPWCCSVPFSVQGRHLLVLGGLKNVGYQYVCTGNIYKYNKASDSWEVIGQIPSPRSGLAAVSIFDSNIVVFGGQNYKRQHTNTVWIGSCEPQ